MNRSEIRMGLRQPVLTISQQDMNRAELARQIAEFEQQGGQIERLQIIPGRDIKIQPLTQEGRARKAAAEKAAEAAQAKSGSRRRKLSAAEKANKELYQRNRSIAMVSGEPMYQGAPCKNGGHTLRRTNSHACVECDRKKSRGSKS